MDHGKAGVDRGGCLPQFRGRLRLPVVQQIPEVISCARVLRVGLRRLARARRWLHAGTGRHSRAAAAIACLRNAATPSAPGPFSRQSSPGSSTPSGGSCSCPGALAVICSSVAVPSCQSPAFRYSAAVSCAVAGCWFMVEDRALPRRGVLRSEPAFRHRAHIERVDAVRGRGQHLQSPPAYVRGGAARRPSGFAPGYSGRWSRSSG